jgi:predicted dehydrogenase
MPGSLLSLARAHSPPWSMKHAPFRLGIAGCGRIARAVHLPFLVAQPNVQIVAIAYADPVALAAARRSAPRAATLSRDVSRPGRWLAKPGSDGRLHRVGA